MEIKVTPEDIRNWIELAETHEAMADALAKCATVFIMVKPEGTKFSDAERLNEAMERAKKEAIESLRSQMVLKPLTFK